MITGTVTAYREAIIRLNVRGPGGGEKTVEAVIDTGFDGVLTLPTSVVAALSTVTEEVGVWRCVKRKT